MSLATLTTKTFCEFCLGAVVLGWLAAQPARAVLMTDGSNEADYRNLATQYSNSLAYLSLTDSVGPYSASGVFLNNSWVLTAAHVAVNPFGAGDGTFTGIVQGASPGNPSIPVVATWIYPGYSDSVSRNSPDVMLVKLAPGPTAPSLTIGSAPTGSIVTSAVFGIYGTPSGGLHAGDSNARAWNAKVDSLTGGGYSSTYYQSTDFGFNNNGVSLNGRGLGGDSGGPVFNGQGQMVGINIAAGGGLSGLGGTEFLTLSQPEVYAWIQNTITPVEPQSLSLTREGADVRLAWQGKGGSNYVVQAATALGGTNTFSDLSASITLVGVGPVTTNYLDLGALTNQPARFYRVRSN